MATVIISQSTEHFEMAVFATPPNPGQTVFSTPTCANPDYAALLAMHEKGLISRDELRSKVFASGPVIAAPVITVVSPIIAPVTRVKNTAAAAKTLFPSKRNRDIMKSETSASEEPACKKQKTKRRPGKPSDDIALLRKISMDTTRRRFFDQCCKRDSVLWYCPENSTSEHLVRVLFDKAATDPLNLIYAANPGATRGTNSSVLRNVIKWRVTKDRANWRGKKPKRHMLLGQPLPFDWEGELKKIKQPKTVVKQEAPTLIKKTRPPVTIETTLIKETRPVVEKPPSRTTIPPPKPVAHVSVPRAPSSIPPSFQQTSTREEKPFDVDFCKECFACRVSVWVGDNSKMPKSMQLAFPSDADWCNPNVQPYCKNCWDQEMELLTGMGAQHKAMGAKNKVSPNKSEEQSTANSTMQTGKKKADKKKQKKKRKRKKKKKKQLGGVHGPLVVQAAPADPVPAAAPADPVPAAAPAAPVPVTVPVRWEVGAAVNCRFTNGKFYGAFITAVNDDGSYRVYFPEEPDCPLDNVPAKAIKKPIMGGKSSMCLIDYKGKVFFDKGTPRDDPDDDYFEPGEFIVHSVADGNNFDCLRVTETDETKVIPFDIGYCMKRIRVYEEQGYRE